MAARMIPKSTKVKVEFIKGFNFGDIFVMIKKPYSNVSVAENYFVSLYGEEKIADALLYAKDLKDRYSILWLNYFYFED